MIERIRRSLWLKIFLLLPVILWAAGMLLYSLVMIAMPPSYRSLLQADFTDLVSGLIVELEGITLGQAESLIYDFCADNGTSAALIGSETRLAFGSEALLETGSDVLQTATTVVSINDSSYTLQIAAPGRSLNQLPLVFQRLGPAMSAAALAFSLSASYLISRYLAKPVTKISEASQRLAALQLTERCDTDRTDEIGTLAVNLNTMAARLADTIQKLANANEQLRADVEEERRQKSLRLEFFRAVSHELKTPLTILKGELEGMICRVGEYRDRDRHLRQALQTTNNMEDLVSEILSISRLSDSTAMCSAPVNLTEIVKRTCSRWKGPAEDRHQLLDLDIAQDCLVKGDAAQLEKVISNVIGNAVLHSPDEAQISVSLRHGKFSVRNNGTSIAPEELAQVFEPFYRLDTSRRRTTGGSGLGLCIVRTILERHRFTCNLTSDTNSVTFLIQF